MSTFLMTMLVVEYLIIAAVCVAENNMPRCMYWVAAALLNVSVIWGMK